MKHILLTAIIWCLFFRLTAQDANQIILEDSLIGWTKLYNYKGVKEGKSVGGRVYTAKQLSICDSFANWIQASYIPKGGLGDIKRFSTGRGSSSTPYEAGLPNRYGATAYSWSVKLINGKIEPIPETQFWWSITANGVPIMPEWVIADLTDSISQFFLLPSFSTEDAVRNKQYYKDQDLSANESISSYIYRWIYRSTGGGTENIILAKDNNSPFRVISKGEFLQEWQKAAATVHVKMLKKINYDYSGDKVPLEIATKNENKLHEDCLAHLGKMRDLYKSRLNEPAEINTLQHDRRDIAKGRDLFEKRGNTDTYPVYTLEKGVVGLSKNDAPQWILINWNWNKSDAKELHMHQSIINNFNFNYVYNFFFYPEKVKGIRYSPLKSPYPVKKIVNNHKSETAFAAEKDKHIHFFNDLSSNTPDEPPIDWYHSQSLNGEKAKVVELESNERWLQIKGNKIFPKSLTTPLPQNFTFSFDLAVPEKFPWGGRSMEITFGKNTAGGSSEANFLLNLRPGYNGRPGEVYFETKLPPGYYESRQVYSVPGFSNNKKINKVNIAFQKNGEQLQLFVDKKLVVDIKKGVPAHLLFNSLSFSHIRSDSDNEKYYIANLKITVD